jgi:signal transduction histidine kinase
MDTMKPWLTRAARAVGTSLRELLLTLVVNLPLLVLWLTTLILIPVFGLGLLALPGATFLIRARADAARRVAARSGIAIASPYAPRRRIIGLLADAATWRDFAWLLSGTIVRIVSSALVLGLIAYGLHGVLLLPYWFWLGGVPYGYGVFWPTGSTAQALSALPQGALIMVAGLAVAPHITWLAAAFDRLLLAPTRAAQLRLRVARLTETRADTVDAQAAELRRIERDLHDGTQARLASLGMTIGLAEELLERDPQAARKLLAEARETSGAALVELRHLVRGIHPPVLAERGLDGAIRALALSLPLPVTVHIALPARPDTPVESAAYFAVAELLANIVRHAGAAGAAVTVEHAAGRLLLTVSDDGRGGADPSLGGTGLRGVQRRLAAFDGTMTLSSPAGGPTVVTMELPCELSSPKTSPSSGTG